MSKMWITVAYDQHADEFILGVGQCKTSSTEDLKDNIYLDAMSLDSSDPLSVVGCWTIVAQYSFIAKSTSFTRPLDFHIESVIPHAED